MKKYIFRGQEVWLFSQTGDEVLFSEKLSKKAPLRTVSVRTFFQEAVEVKGNGKNKVIVNGKKPTKKKPAVEPEIIEVKPVKVKPKPVVKPKVEVEDEDDLYGDYL